MTIDTSFQSTQVEALIANEVLKKINPENSFYEDEPTYGPTREAGGQCRIQYPYSTVRLQSLENSFYQHEFANFMEVRFGGSWSHTLTNASAKDVFHKVLDWFKGKKETNNPTNTFSMPNEPGGMYSNEENENDMCLMDCMETRLNAPKNERKKIKVKVKRIGRTAPSIKIDDEWTEWL